MTSSGETHGVGMLRPSQIRPAIEITIRLATVIPDHAISAELPPRLHSVHLMIREHALSASRPSAEAPPPPERRPPRSPEADVVSPGRRGEVGPKPQGRRRASRRPDARLRAGWTCLAGRPPTSRSDAEPDWILQGRSAR